MHCIDQPFTIGQLWINKNVINSSPDYQRESAVWSKEKQQLFVDSILNNFDIPKIYFHDLRGTNSLHHFNVVDGKQRLYAVYEFLTDKFPLGDFEPWEKTVEPPPVAGQFYSTLSEYWKEFFKSKTFSVVLIQNASEEDIEELFSRLNNGEPLNAAEKRNAMGGDMCRLIREISKHDFFTGLPISNSRYQHLEIAAKLIQLEWVSINGGGLYSDLKKKFLDNLVESNKSMQTAVQEGLKKRVVDGLDQMVKIFGTKNPLLKKQAAVPLYYLFSKKICTDYAGANIYFSIGKFIQDFEVLRTKNRDKPEEERDVALMEFGRLMQQGTNDINSLKERIIILSKYFVLENTSLRIKDKDRTFSEEERYAIWVIGGKKCANCGCEIPMLDGMHADHKQQWALGGETTLSNGRCLCVHCNTSLAVKIN